MLISRQTDESHESRPIILEGRSIFRFGLKIVKANYFFVDCIVLHG